MSKKRNSGASQVLVLGAPSPHSPDLRKRNETARERYDPIRFDRRAKSKKRVYYGTVWVPSMQGLRKAAVNSATAATKTTAT